MIFWEACPCLVLLAVQRAGLQEELQFLAKQERIQPSRVKELRLFLSTDGLRRCQMRLAEAEFLPFDAKNLFLSHAGENVTDLIMHFYEQANQGLERFTVSVLREKHWVVKAIVKQIMQSLCFYKFSRSEKTNLDEEHRNRIRYHETLWELRTAFFRFFKT